MARKNKTTRRPRLVYRRACAGCGKTDCEFMISRRQLNIANLYTTLGTLANTPGDAPQVLRDNRDRLIRQRLEKVILSLEEEEGERGTENGYILACKERMQDNRLGRLMASWRGDRDNG